MIAPHTTTESVPGTEVKSTGLPAVCRTAFNQFTLNNERLNSGRLQAIRNGDAVITEKTDTMVFDGQTLFVLILHGAVIKAGTLKLSDDPECITLSGLNPNKILYPDERISTRAILQAYRITGCLLNRNINQILATA